MNIAAKTLAVAVLVAVTGSASAAIDNGNLSGNGTLFFNAYDPDAGVSFVKALDVNFLGFLAPQASPVAKSYDLSTDADWTTFLSSVTVSSVQWNVVALDSRPVAGTSIDGARYLTTSATDPTVIANIRNSQLKQFGPRVFSYIATSNALLDTINQSAVHAKDSDTDDAYFGYGFQDNWGGAAGDNLDSTAAIGESQAFYQLSLRSTPTLGTFNLARVVATPYAQTWTLGTDGVLSYGSTAPIPEPGTWALTALGLIGVGFAARRRASA